MEEFDRSIKTRENVPTIIQESPSEEVEGEGQNAAEMTSAQIRSKKWRSSVFNSLDISGDDLEQAYDGQQGSRGFFFVCVCVCVCVWCVCVCACVLCDKYIVLLIYADIIFSNSIEHSHEHLSFSLIEVTPTTPDILFLVFHGGSIYDSLSGQFSAESNLCSLDFSTFRSNVETITELHFSSAIGRVAMHLVPCRDFCKDALQLLSQVGLQAVLWRNDDPLP